jgi:hypothetical protein
MKKSIIFAALLMGATSAALAHDGNNGWVTISTFNLWSNTYSTDTIRIEAADYYNPAGAACNNVDSYMVSSTISSEARQRIYSTLLAAKLANKSVRLSLDTSTCQEGRPKILYVMLN